MAPQVVPIHVSIAEATEILGVGPRKMYALCDERAVETRYVGRRRLVVLESLHTYAANLPTSYDEARVS